MKLLLFATLFFIISVTTGSPAGAPVQNLWDQIVRQEQVVLSVTYRGRILNVWKQGINNYTRFYVSPLCNIDVNSFSCEKDVFHDPPRMIFGLKIKLWDFQVATVVQKALKQKGISVETGDIVILPMQFVRIKLDAPNSYMEADDKWKSFGDEPLVMAFQLYPKDEVVCQTM
uniref:Uncharacterized protein n=1 Tax=Panagrolaimus sp. ES5 TaxID=591445 RepID=A0AC34G077_9BILA